VGGKLAPMLGAWQSIRMTKSRAKKSGMKGAGKERHHLQEVIAHAEELIESTAGDLGEKAQEVRRKKLSQLKSGFGTWMM
jgi:ElaB/YqjD/DUF883 family membrane-anchored ribosome-binding protein